VAVLDEFFGDDATDVTRAPGYQYFHLEDSVSTDQFPRCFTERESGLLTDLFDTRRSV
jgi:hypothetical protein